MKLKVLSIIGILSPILYIISTIVGGLLRPEYSHLTYSVSELLVYDAPFRTYLLIPFSIGEIFTIIFGFGLFIVFKSKQSTLSSKTGLSGFLILGILGILGFASIAIFPMDIPGSPSTIHGLMHLILVGIQSLGSMITILLIGLWFKNNGLKGYGIYSFISLALVFITGIIAMIGPILGSLYIGLLERLTVGTYAQWLIILALKFYSFDLNSY